jgi:hypothetical protein
MRGSDQPNELKEMLESAETIWSIFIPMRNAVKVFFSELYNQHGTETGNRIIEPVAELITLHI